MSLCMCPSFSVLSLRVCVFSSVCLSLFLYVCVSLSMRLMIILYLNQLQSARVERRNIYNDVGTASFFLLLFLLLLLVLFLLLLLALSARAHTCVALSL